MKLVWEIQTYPVINFPKYGACQLRDIKKLEDSLESSESSMLLHWTELVSAQSGVVGNFMLR